MWNGANRATALSGYHSINHATTKAHDSCQGRPPRIRRPIDHPISTERKSYNPRAGAL